MPKAPKTKIHRQTYGTLTCELEVEGTLWGTGKVKHVYDMAGKQIPANLKEAKKIAGDFESLDRATLITTAKKIKATTTIQFLT